MKKYGKWIIMAACIVAVVLIVFAVPVWKKIAEKKNIPIISKKSTETEKPSPEPEEEETEEEAAGNGNIKVKLKESSLNKGVLTCEFKNVNQIYNINNSKSIHKQLEKKKKNSCTLEQPLLAINPYGTNYNSLYIYFKTEEKCYAEYTVKTEDETIPAFTRRLHTGEEGPVKEHEYQLLGLIPGQTNSVTVKLYDENNKVLKEHTYKVSMEASKTGTQTRLTANRQTGTKLTDGLFFLFGNDEGNKNTKRSILLYDNDGIIRGEIPLTSYRSDKVMLMDGKLLYGYGYGGLALVSRTGRVEKNYFLAKYKQHHDFVYDGNGNLLILATRKDADTIEDVVISLNMKKGTTKEILDFNKLLPELKNAAVKPPQKKTLDWIHLTSLQLVGKNDLLFSSRELSAVIKVKNVFEKPKLEYILADEDVWKGKPYEQKLYQKQGEFVSHAGQHTVSYIADKSLSNGSYYLEFFNNNYGYSSTNQSFDWTKISGVGVKGTTAANSMCYKYLVNEKAKTYELVQEIKVPYSSIVGSVQSYRKNKIISSGTAKSFGEYSETGELLAVYKLDISSYMYKVEKYSMEGFWFR